MYSAPPRLIFVSSWFHAAASALEPITLIFLISPSEFTVHPFVIDPENVIRSNFPDCACDTVTYGASSSENVFDAYPADAEFGLLNNEVAVFAYVQMLS